LPEMGNMNKKKKGFKGGLLGEYILYGIFVGISVFLVIKYLVGWNITKLQDIAALTFLASVVSGIVIAGLFSYFLSKRSIKKFSIETVNTMIKFLQQKNILPLQYEQDELQDSNSAKNRIMGLLGLLTDRITELNRKKKEFEDTLARYKDLKEMSSFKIKNSGGEIKDVTILFTDIKNFSEFYQNTNTEAVIRFLNIYITEVTKIIQGQNGIVNKIIGDETMSVFEAKTGEDRDTGHELRAINAAMEIIRKFDGIMAEANVSLPAPMKIAFGIGIGIHSGPAMIGTIGSKERMEFTVLGDTVELAGHVALNADIGATLITEDTYQRLGKRVEVIEPGPLNLGGKIGSCRVFIVKGINLITR